MKTNNGINDMKPEDIHSISDRIKKMLEVYEIDSAKRDNIVVELFNSVNDYVNQTLLGGKLSILFNYEKHYLELIKEFKEEIKFALSMQEDLRRERAQFFTQILKEAADTLKKAEVDSQVSSKWIQELVDSYTKSIDLSSDLAKTHVIDILGKIKEEAKRESKSISEKKISD